MVKGGVSAAGTVTLNNTAGPGGVTVALNSANTAVANPTVASITIPNGSKTGGFNITTGAVGVLTPVTISATAAGTTKTVVLKVTP